MRLGRLAQAMPRNGSSGFEVISMRLTLSARTLSTC